MPRKALPDDQKGDVFGLTVPKLLLDAYKKLGKDKKKTIRSQVSKSFEQQVFIAIGGQMVASDDRVNNKT